MCVRSWRSWSQLRKPWSRPVIWSSRTQTSGLICLSSASGWVHRSAHLACLSLKINIDLPFHHLHFLRLREPELTFFCNLFYFQTGRQKEAEHFYKIAKSVSLICCRLRATTAPSFQTLLSVSGAQFNPQKGSLLREYEELKMQLQVCHLESLLGTRPGKGKDFKSCDQTQTRSWKARTF